MCKLKPDENGDLPLGTKPDTSDKYNVSGEKKSIKHHLNNVSVGKYL